jgi:hypothetical protein
MGLVIRALAGGQVVAAQRRLVTRIAPIALVAAAGLAAPGCFYTDPINQRPSLDIKQTSTDAVFRGDTIRLEAVSNDPEGQFVTFKWRAYLCTSESDCDRAPFFGGFEDYFTFTVPRTRNDVDAPVQAVHVWLEGMDDFGATAKPAQQIWLTVFDRAPTLELRKDSRYGYVVSTPINVFAKVGDPDDWPAVPELAWEVFTPTNQPTYELVDIAVPQDVEDPDHLQFAKRFTPQGSGDYELRVTATDRIGEESVQSLMITVGPDAPPCLRTLSPIVAPTGSALPMSEPTLFQVHVVTDDLDPYPTVNDPLLGTTQFSWSLKTNTGARQLLGVGGNHVALDPASYQPGDIVEVRVEIADRNDTAIECVDANQTCSVISDVSCIQRQTWRVEVR